VEEVLLPIGMKWRNRGPARQRTGLTPLEITSLTGLTLIELTLVAFLLLTIIGLSIPLFRKTFSNFSAQDASFNMSKLINYAQQMAVLERKDFKIVFDFEKGSYQLFEIDNLSKEPVYRKAKGRFGKLFVVPQGLKLTGDKNTMIFYPDGHCDDIKVNMLAKGGGHSVIVKRFGNAVEVKRIEIE
jgi:hypothetical protein